MQFFLVDQHFLTEVGGFLGELENIDNYSRLC